MRKKSLFSVLAAGLLVLAGCVTSPLPTIEVIPGDENAVVGLYSLRPLDPIRISLLGIPDAKDIEVVIDEKGEISLPYINEPVRAAGLSATGLQREIQRVYTEQQIYRNITVNVQTSGKTYFMEGEVRRPQEYPLTRRITLLQAIAAASGYTEYANPRRITITRGGKVYRVNARELERNPERDIVVEAGDRIHVGRSFY